MNLLINFMNEIQSENELLLYAPENASRTF